MVLAGVAIVVLECCGGRWVSGCDGVVRPGRAGRGDARSRAACTASLGDLIKVFVKIVDALSGSAGMVGNWVGARRGVLRRAEGNATGCRARGLGCACVPKAEQ